MVKIINGEIVADDDPRLQQRHQSAASGPAGASSRGGAEPAGAQGPAGGGGGGSGLGFNLSAPPLSFVPPAPGVESLLGLPDAQIFGVRITPYAILAVVGLGLFMGWRGAVVGLVLYYVYLANQNAGPAGPGQGPLGGNQAGHRAPQQQQQPQQQPGSGGTDFLQRYWDGPKPRSRADATGAGGQTPGGQAGGPQQQAHPGAQAAAPSGAAAGGAGDGGWAAFKGKGNKLGGN